LWIFSTILTLSVNLSLINSATGRSTSFEVDEVDEESTFFEGVDGCLTTLEAEEIAGLETGGFNLESVDDRLTTLEAEEIVGLETDGLDGGGMDGLDGDGGGMDGLDGDGGGMDGLDGDGDGLEDCFAGLEFRVRADTDTGIFLSIQ
jgi:hypothetical protein